MALILGLGLFFYARIGIIKIPIVQFHQQRIYKMTPKESATAELLRIMREQYPEGQHVSLYEFGLVEGQEKAVQWQAAGSPSIWDVVATHENIVVMFDYAYSGIALFDMKNIDDGLENFTAVVVRSNHMIFHGNVIAVNANINPTGKAWLYGAIEGSTFTDQEVAEGLLASGGVFQDDTPNDQGEVAKADPVEAAAVVQPEVKAEAPAPEGKPEATTEAAPATKAKSAKA